MSYLNMYKNANFVYRYPGRWPWRGSGERRLCVFSLLVFHRITQKSTQLGSPNLTRSWSTMSPLKPIYFEVKGSKVKVTRHQKHFRRRSWRSCGGCYGFFWYLSAFLCLLFSLFRYSVVFCGLNPEKRLVD